MTISYFKFFNVLKLKKMNNFKDEPQTLKFKWSTVNDNYLWIVH